MSDKSYRWVCPSCDDPRPHRHIFPAVGQPHKQYDAPIPMGGQHSLPPLNSEDILRAVEKKINGGDTLPFVTGLKIDVDAFSKRSGLNPTNIGLPESVLQEAQRLVHGDRGSDYGHPFDDYTTTSQLWEALLGLPPGTIGPRKAVMMMVLMKLSRESRKPKRDNRVDIAGYDECLDMIVEKEQENEERFREAPSSGGSTTTRVQLEPDFPKPLGAVGATGRLGQPCTFCKTGWRHG